MKGFCRVKGAFDCASSEGWWQS